MLEMVNRICELTENLTKAQIMIEQRDRNIEEMREYVEKQNGEMQQLRAQIANMRQPANS
jgi:hypothetical protein